MANGAPVNERPLLPTLIRTDAIGVSHWSSDLTRQLITVFQQYGFRINQSVTDDELTAELADVVRDADILDVVRDADILDVVRTSDPIMWMAKAIGEPFGLRDDWMGTPVPPTDNPDFRFIKLTAGEDGVGQYNEGVLISESVTGSAPLVVATAVIDHAGSPINGEMVNLWNTENRYPKPGTSSGTVANDQMQGHAHDWKYQNQDGNTTVAGGNALANSTTAGNIYRSGVASGSISGTMRSDHIGSAITDDYGSDGTPRTGASTDVKHQQLTYYMRIA